MNVSDTLGLLSPQLIMLATAFVLLIWDLFLKNKPSQKRYLPWLAIVGALLAFVVSQSLFWSGGKTLVLSTVVVDRFALFFQFVAELGVVIVILGAISYMKDKTPYSGEFYALLLVAAAAVMFMASATDLMLMYVSLEFLSITSYILAGYLRGDAKSNEASIKYFLYGAVASAVMLYGISMLYGATGATSFKAVAAGLKNGSKLGWLGFPAIVLLLAGFGYKASLVPFHQWAPDTYDGAPTPVAAFLATISKAAGFAVLIRVFLEAMPSFQAEWVAVLAGLSMVTMTLGNFVALKQTNVKRLLAYSSIAQAGYILTGVVAIMAAGTKLNFNGINGVLLYLFAYLFTNGGAFLTVAGIEEKTGSVDVSDYDGLVKRSPAAAALLAVFLFSLAGIPSTGGFIGKFFVFGSVIEVGYYFLALVAILNTVVAAAYYLKIVQAMFFKKPSAEGSFSLSRTLMIALVISLIFVFWIGVFPNNFIRLATQSSAAVLLVR